jgi:hypothetical protein
MPDLKVFYILALALLPGAFGNWTYRLLVGVRWGEEQWRYGLRLFGFSVFGLVLYSLATMFGAPEPTYIFPIGFASIIPATLPVIAVAYVGHCAAGAVVGILAAGATRVASMVTGISGYPCAWDDFIWVWLLWNDGQLTVRVAAGTCNGFPTMRRLREIRSRQNV